MKSRWLLVLGAGALIPAVAWAQGLSRADPEPARPIVTQVCASCHAEDGNSVLPVNPVLAGQHADYTFKQLMNFKPQDGKPAERPNAVMAGMIANLSVGDLRNLAAYFEGQRLKPRAARDPGLVRLRQSIYRRGNAAQNAAARPSPPGPQ